MRKLATKAFLTIVLAVPAHANDYSDCGQFADFALQISSCTRIIVSVDQANHFIARNNRGTAFHHLGKYERAIEDFTAAIWLAPGYAEAYTNRGVTHAALGKHDLAIADLSNAVRFNPGYAIGYNNRGNYYTGLGKHDLAIADYSKAVELLPDYAQAYYGRGSAYAALGKADEAKADIEKAHELDSANYQAPIKSSPCRH